MNLVENDSIYPKLFINVQSSEKLYAMQAMCTILEYSVFQICGRVGHTTYSNII